MRAAPAWSRTGGPRVADEAVMVAIRSAGRGGPQRAGAGADADERKLGSDERSGRRGAFAVGDQCCCVGTTGGSA